MLRAYLLAGGLGTRLRARLGSLPAVLAPFGDGTLLDTQLDWLAQCGVNEVVVALGVRAQPAVGRIRVRPADAVPKVSWTVDPVPLGTGGALALAARGETRTFLVVGGSTLAEVDLVALLERHRARAAELTIAAFRAAPAAAGLELDADDRVLGFAALPVRGEEPWTAGGVYLCEPGFLAEVPGGRPSDLEAEVLPAAVAAGRPVCALRCRGRRWDVGTPEGLDRAAREWRGAGGKRE